MREPRVYTGQPLYPGGSVRLEPSAGRRLLDVLRLRAGASLRLFNGDGEEYLGRLNAASKHGADVQVEALTASEPPPRLELNLLLGVSKGERMDWAMQKTVELGATRILPLFTVRSVVRLKGERLERRMDHWRNVVVSACEQCGRCRLPQLDRAAHLSQAVEPGAADLRLLLHHGGALGLDALPPPRRGIDLLVGPEGGLEQTEIHLAVGHGFVPVRLGPRIMRAETAPLAALAAIQTLWGDFRASEHRT